jgi:hypothetical protein
MLITLPGRLRIGLLLGCSAAKTEGYTMNTLNITFEILADRSSHLTVSLHQI